MDSNALRNLIAQITMAADAIDASKAAEQRVTEQTAALAAVLARRKEADAQLADALRLLKEAGEKREAANAAFKAEAEARRKALGESLEAERKKRTSEILADTERLQHTYDELAAKLPPLKADITTLTAERELLTKAVDTLKASVRSL